PLDVLRDFMGHLRYCSFLTSMKISHFFLAVMFFGLSAAFAGGQPKLVLLQGDRFVLDLRYATDDNFLKKNVYREFGLNQCYVHPDLAAKLQKLPALLAEKKLKLVLWDCYRPLAVQKAMWKLVPDSRYVADPKMGSNHNRGIAVDATLADENVKLLEMPTGFDDFSSKASPGYVCGTEEKKKCANRALLMEVMGKIGLKPLNSEWWHYQLPNANGYPIIEALDVPPS
ncbi:MAG TPA: M15 family metallopeptidase, partial [Candidatus Binatia bacterium]